MSQSLREEFRLSSIGLNYPLPEAFLYSQWRCSRWLYLFWRWLAFLWHVAIIVASAVNFREHHARSADEAAKWFIYYSHITFILTAVTCGIDLLGAQTAPPGPEDKNNEEAKIEKEEIVFQAQFVLIDGLKERPTPCLSKVTWFLYNIINSSNILASAWFWAVTYDSHTYAVDIVAHVTNTVYVVSNLLVSAQPVRLLHAVYPAVYTGLYVAFSAVYHEAGGTDETGRRRIYDELDWSDEYPTAVTAVVGVLVVAPLLHAAVVFALFTFRVYLHARLGGGSEATYAANNKEGSPASSSPRPAGRVGSPAEEDSAKEPKHDVKRDGGDTSGAQSGETSL